MAISVTTFEVGSPDSLVGKPIDAIVKKVEVATSDQSHSLGVMDTDVLAKEGQAAEKAW